MRQPFSLLLLPVLVLAGAVLLATEPQARAQPAAPTIQLETDFTVGPPETIRVVKFPHIAAFGNTVHVGTSSQALDAYYWAKPDAANTFPPAERLGSATGVPDFSNVAVATGADGAVYYAWIDRPDDSAENSEAIYLRKKAPGASTFGPQRRVAIQSDSEFDVAVELTVLSNNTIIVAWRVSDKASRYSVSTDEGVSWSTPTVLSRFQGDQSLYFPALAAGPNNTAVLATTQADNGLQVFGGVWNGSSFSFERIGTAGLEFSDPHATIAPNGRMFLTYRKLPETDRNQQLTSGVFLAEYVNGAWQKQQIVSNNVVLTSYICADAQNNLHLVWVGKRTETDELTRVYYSIRPEGGTFVEPIEATPPGGFVFNGRLACTVDAATGRPYAHFVSEFFGGGSSFMRYQRFSASPSAAGPTARPVIKDNAEIINGAATVSVNFLEVTGEPAEIRWRWNSPPSNDASDSNGWQPYANPIEISVPDVIRNDTSCKVNTLFVQFADSADLAGRVASDDVKVDGQVNALIAVTNPYLKRKRSVFDPPTPSDFNDSGGASDGHPDYTRAPIFYVDLGTPGECSGLKDIALGRTATSIRPARTVTGDRFANVVPFPGAFEPGPNQVVVRVTDKAGNITDVTRSLTYDVVPPVLNSGSAGSVSLSTPLSETTLLATLSFAGVQVTDDTYPGKGFWGVWVANSRTAVSDPTSDANLVWTPVEVAGDSSTFVISRWSLATGLSASAVSPGEYFVYVRFLDGAGNPTTGFLNSSITINAVTLPASYVPMIFR